MYEYDDLLMLAFARVILVGRTLFLLPVTEKNWAVQAIVTVHIRKTDVDKASSRFPFVLLSQSGCGYIRDAHVNFFGTSQRRHYDSMYKDCNHLKVGLEGGGKESCSLSWHILT